MDSREKTVTPEEQKNTCSYLTLNQIIIKTHPNEFEFRVWQSTKRDTNLSNCIEPLIPIFDIWIK